MRTCTGRHSLLPAFILYRLWYTSTARNHRRLRVTLSAKKMLLIPGSVAVSAESVCSSLLNIADFCNKRNNVRRCWKNETTPAGLGQNFSSNAGHHYPCRYSEHISMIIVLVSSGWQLERISIAATCTDVVIPAQLCGRHFQRRRY